MWSLIGGAARNLPGSIIVWILCWFKNSFALAILFRI